MVAPGRKSCDDVQEDQLCLAGSKQTRQLQTSWQTQQQQQQLLHDTSCWLLQDSPSLPSPDELIGDLSSPALSGLPRGQEPPPSGGDEPLPPLHSEVVAAAMLQLTEAEQEKDMVEACLAVKALLCSEYEGLCHAAACALQEVPCSVSSAGAGCPLQHLLLLLQRCSSAEAAGAACELLHSLLAPHQRPKTRGSAVSLLLCLRAPDVLVRCLQRLLPPVFASSSASSASSDALALSGCQVITKLLAKDPRGPVRLRLVGGVSLVLRLLQERLARRPMPPLLPLLILLSLAAKNGSNQQLLGREGALRTLVSLLSSASKKHLTKIKYILETLASLAASKSNAVECACYGAVGAAVAALQDWRAVEPRLLNKLMRAAVSLFQRTADTKEGRSVVSSEGAMPLLQDFILSSPDHRSLDTSVCAAVTFFLKCSQGAPQHIYPSNASPLIVFRPPAPGGPPTGAVDVNFPSPSGADAGQVAELEEAGDDEEEEDLTDEGLLNDDDDKPANDHERGRLKDDYLLTPCDDFSASGSSCRLPLAELLSYGRFCPELSSAPPAEGLCFWRSVSALSKDGGAASCAAPPPSATSPITVTSPTITSTSPTTTPTSPTTTPTSPTTISPSPTTTPTSPTTTATSPTTLTSPNTACTSEVYSRFTESTKSLLPFVKIAYPDLVGGVSPRHLEPLHVRDPRLARTRGVQRVERQLRGHVLQRVVYDLDALLHAHRSQQLITPSAAPPHRSLGNWDEKRVGRRDVSSRSLNFESRFEGGNLRRAVQVDDREYELVVRSDISSTQHHQWFYFEVSNMEAGAPYVFSIINNEKPTSEYNAGMRPLLFSVREATHGRCHWVRTGTNIVYHKNHYRRPPYTATHFGSAQDTASNAGPYQPVKKTAANRGQTSLSYYTASFTIIFPHAYDICYLAYLYPYSYTRLKSFLSSVEETVPADVFYSCQTLCHTLNGNPVPVLTITSKDTQPLSVIRHDQTETEKVGLEPPFIGESRIAATSASSSDRSYSEPVVNTADGVGEAKARVKVQRPVDFGQDLKCNLNRPRTEDDTKHSTSNSLDCDSSRNSRPSNFDISCISTSNNVDFCDSNSGDTVFRRRDKSGNTLPCDTNVVNTDCEDKVTGGVVVESVSSVRDFMPPKDNGVSDVCSHPIVKSENVSEVGDASNFDSGGVDGRDDKGIGNSAVSTPSSCYSTPTLEILYSDLFSDDGSSKFSFVKPSSGKKASKTDKAQTKPTKSVTTKRTPEKKSEQSSKRSTEEATEKRRDVKPISDPEETCIESSKASTSGNDHLTDCRSSGVNSTSEGRPLKLSVKDTELPDFRNSSAVEDMWAKLTENQRPSTKDVPSSEAGQGAGRKDLVPAPEESAVSSGGYQKIFSVDNSQESLVSSVGPSGKSQVSSVCPSQGSQLSSVHQSKPVVFLSSRVHPGESNASWLMEGSVRWLLSPDAAALRRRCVVKIVPMLNVEGVIHGNTRCGLTGEDLNRRWRLPSPHLHPSIYHTKALLEYITRVLGHSDEGAQRSAVGGHARSEGALFSPSTTAAFPPAERGWSAAEDHAPQRQLPSRTAGQSTQLTESRDAEDRCEVGRTPPNLQDGLHQLRKKDQLPDQVHDQDQLQDQHQLQEKDQLPRGVVVYCDYHGHSRQKNLFLYGCSRQLSWWPEDCGLPDHPHLTRLPALCQETVSCFSGPHCCYTVERARESTARVAVWRQYDVACSYTLEASASGCDQGVYQGYHLGTHQLVEAGAQFCEALHQLLCPAPAALTHQLHLGDAALHHASSSEEESNESGCESDV